MDAPNPEVQEQMDANTRRKANARHKRTVELVNEYTADGGDLDAPVHQLINWTYEQTKF